VEPALRKGRERRRVKGGREGGREDALEGGPVEEEEEGANHSEHIAGVGSAVLPVVAIEDH